MRPADRFVRRAMLAACATMLVLLVGAAGCTAPTATSSTAPAFRSARVELVNLSECDWRITIAKPPGAETRTMQLPARETNHVDLPGGDYVITQTALSGLVGADSTRQFSAHLEAGEAYRWRLVTLFSSTAAAPP